MCGHMAQVAAEAAAREDALQAAEEALVEAEATARVAMRLKEELYEATEAAQHLQSELAAAQVRGVQHFGSRYILSWNM